MASTTDGTALPSDFESSLAPDLTAINEQTADISQQIDTQTANYDALQSKVEASLVDSRATLDKYESVVMEGIADSSVSTDEAVAPFREQLDTQLTNIRNSYDLQVTQQAKQVDALVGSGAFSGNAFRAQQAYTSSMQSLTSQSLGQIAEFALSSEETILGATLTENQRLSTDRTKYVELLGKSASMSLDAASVYTSDSLGILSGKTSAVNSLLGLQAGLAETSSQLSASAAQTYAQAQLQVLSNRTAITQANISAAAQRYSANKAASASRAASAAQVSIAKISAASALQRAEISADTARYSINSQASAAAADLERQTAIAQPSFDAFEERIKTD